MAKHIVEMAIAAVVAGCASSEPVSAASDRPLVFVCAGAKSFAVEPRPGAAQITTEAGSFLLEPRPSSIGLRFASAAATLIIDEDRAALNGLPGGPFRDCREQDGRTSGSASDPAGAPLTPAPDRHLRTSVDVGLAEGKVRAP